MIAPQPHNTKDQRNPPWICSNTTTTQSLPFRDEQTSNGQREIPLLKLELPLLKGTHLYWLFLGP
jgi:hypothetical protein